MMMWAEIAPSFIFFLDTHTASKMESVATFLLMVLVSATLSSAIPKPDDHKRVIDKVLSRLVILICVICTGNSLHFSALKVTYDD